MNKRNFEDRVGIPSGMVRIISCHHFLSQDVFLSDSEPVALCTAQEKLLVATLHHSIEVRDLDHRGRILHTFPTVDRVKQVIYCDAGNYVATLERKSSRHSNPITYVRVYLNWWIDMKGQPMRVRIAGCVTPSSQSGSGQLEMVELPLDEMALTICCCKKTASLVIGKGKVLSVYSYNLKIHDISKQRFHDFDHLMDISLNFPVQEMTLVEDYFACMSTNEIQVFRVIFDVIQDPTDVSENMSSSGISEKNKSIQSDNNFKTDNQDDCIEWCFETYFDTLCTNNGQQLSSILHENSFPVTIQLPSIMKINQIGNIKPYNNEICGPVVNIPGCYVEVKINPKYETCENITISKAQVITLLYRYFPENGDHGGLQGLNLCPFYVEDKFNRLMVDPLSAAVAVSESYFLSNSPLHSPSYHKLKGLGCFLCGSQVGYLYDVMTNPQLICQYTFTASMKSVAVEPELIHVLTETGLETYTSRLSHKIIQHIENIDNLGNSCPNSEEAVCLLGLRPFLGVEQLALSENHLVLVSTTDDSISSTESIDGASCTIYSLKKPTPQQLYWDLFEMGEYHKNSSPSTYIHLLSEAHMILRSYLLLEEGKCCDKEIKNLYFTSCTLMAEHFISCDVSQDRLLAVPYFNLSQLAIENVIQRVIALHNQSNQDIHILKILILYLDYKLLKSNNSFELSQSTAEMILDIYSEVASDNLWKLILLSGISSYKLEKAILLLKKRITSKKNTAADTLAIAVLLLKKGNKDAAQNMLLSLSKDELCTLLHSIQKLLWNEEFSVSAVGQSDSSNLLDHNIPLLKELLESLLNKKKYADHVNKDIILMMVKIYIKRLEENTKRTLPGYHITLSTGMMKPSSFYGNRQSWLNSVPPFNGQGISRTCINEKKLENNLQDNYCSCWNCNEDFLKLQSLLCSNLTSKEILDYSYNLLETTEIKLGDILKILCSDKKTAIKLLLDNYINAVLPYAFDNFTDEEEEWCYLLSLLRNKLDATDEEKHSTLHQTFQGVLSHLSEILHPAKFVALLNKDEKCYIPFIKRCIEKHQANQLKEKIMSLGMEIKAMM
ncbi:Hermansky-Pudlak syndrome 3 protein-like [Centruroides sculpturatus]|uniref:Hermansky-Pudlak syndrome 3 protein-like n=1 Tax=Centruroides sculpturatus TaxID=218467 RepID=UPI000C6E05E8|nr:Hermansky-Pudlak syndrome 3 protein-like [Centruroides sculpturatus]